jgi:hypothetical protein
MSACSMTAGGSSGAGVPETFTLGYGIDPCPKLGRYAWQAELQMSFSFAELARRRKDITQSPRLRGRHVQKAGAENSSLFRAFRARNSFFLELVLYRFRIAASATADPKIEVSAVNIAT